MTNSFVRILLLAGVAAPIVYFVNLFWWAALTPGFDHAAMLPSEVGRNGQTYAAEFNVGLLAVALLSWAAAAGIFIGLTRTGLHRLAAAAPALLLAAGGFALGMAGLFPLPHPLHYGFGLNLATPFVPLAGAMVLGGSARWSLFALFAAQFIYPAMALAGHVNGQTVGLWIRFVASANFTALAILCLSIRLRITP